MKTTRIELLVPLEIDYGTIRTVLSAERKIRELSVSLRFFGPDHPSAGEWADGISMCAEAIELTTGESVPHLITRLSDAIERSWKRQEAESSAVAARLLREHPDLAQAAKNF